jgi:hypothetical protein
MHLQLNRDKLTRFRDEIIIRSQRVHDQFLRSTGVATGKGAFNFLYSQGVISIPIHV